MEVVLYRWRSLVHQVYDGARAVRGRRAGLQPRIPACMASARGPPRSTNTRRGKGERMPDVRGGTAVPISRIFTRRHFGRVGATQADLLTGWMG